MKNKVPDSEQLDEKLTGHDILLGFLRLGKDLVVKPSAAPLRYMVVGIGDESQIIQLTLRVISHLSDSPQFTVQPVQRLFLLLCIMRNRCNECRGFC